MMTEAILTSRARKACWGSDRRPLKVRLSTARFGRRPSERCTQPDPLLCELFAIGLGQLTEVITHRGEPHRIGKRPAMMGERLSEVAPKFPPVGITDAKLQRYARERRQIPQERIAALGFRPVL